jgi:hypothetical protein
VSLLPSRRLLVVTKHTSAEPERESVSCCSPWSHLSWTWSPEIGGFSTREIKQIIKGLDGLKIVGADIVEVAPAYDTQGTFILDIHTRRILIIHI